MGTIIEFSQFKDKKPLDSFGSEARTISDDVFSRANELKNFSERVGHDFLDMHDDLNGFVEGILHAQKEDISDRISFVRSELQKLIEKAYE